MASLPTLLWLAAAASNGTPSPPAHVPTKAVTSAQATVRILSGARVSLSASAQPEGYKVTAGQVTLENGRRLPAQLVEFQ